VFNGGDRNINVSLLIKLEPAHRPLTQFYQGNGPLYWDGQGTNGGVAKPHPFVK
jgi:hypothetical protein